MYQGDSFFTLSCDGQIGLALLSLGLALIMVALVRLGPRRRALRLGWALVLFWGFLWLSPQIYYTYYRSIIPGLPQQVVIAAPPGPVGLARLLSFTGRADLSDHGKGLLGWAMILTAAAPIPLRRKRVGSAVEKAQPGAHRNR